MSGDAAATLSLLLVGTLVVGSVAETLASKRPSGHALGRRWLANFWLVTLNTFATRVWLPIGSLATASLAAERGWGLLGAWDAPAWVAWPLAFMALDASAYVEHRIFHGVPWLWRVHRVHHADPDCDVTTGLRFHPLEALVSLLTRAALIVAFGPPFAAVFAYEMLATGVGLLAHCNVRVPAALERVVGLLVFTPSLHRIHHSADLPDTDRNFGIVSPLWDRLGGTFAGEPARAEADFVFGLREFADPGELRLGSVLTQPFRSPGEGRRLAPFSQSRAQPRAS